MNEQTIRDFIKKELISVGWKSEDIFEDKNINRGGSVVRADLILLYNLYPLAIVEIKSPAFSIESMISQSIEAIRQTEFPFCITTNGKDIRLVDAISIENLPDKLDAFPSPSDLWKKLGIEWNECDPRIYPPYLQNGKGLRIYQAQAVSAAIDSIMSGNKNIFLSMVTGSGKSITGFEIVWKLIRSGFCKRILILSDRLAILEQVTRIYEPFSDNLFKITSSKNNFQDTNSFTKSIHIALVNTFFEYKGKNALDSIPANFYDLIVIYDLAFSNTIETIFNHFDSAHKLILSSSSFYNKQFSPPTFSYDLNDAIVEEELKAPPGYRTVSLGEIAELMFGIRGSSEIDASPNSPSMLAISTSVSFVQPVSKVL